MYDDLPIREIEREKKNYHYSTQTILHVFGNIEVTIVLMIYQLREREIKRERVSKFIQII